MRTRRRTGSYEVGRARREAILDAAIEHFAESGYSRTGMAQIAEDVGLTPRGLLHHFPTKRHLLTAVAEKRFDDAARWIQSIPREPAATRALRSLVALAERFQSQPGLIELALLMAAESADPDSPAREMLARRHALAVEYMRQDFEEGIRSGELKRDLDPVTLARECIAVCDGLQLGWMQSGKSFDLAHAVREFADAYQARLWAEGSSITS